MVWIPEFSHVFFCLLMYYVLCMYLCTAVSQHVVRMVRDLWSKYYNEDQSYEHKACSVSEFYSEGFAIEVC